MNIDSFLLLLILNIWNRCHDRVLIFLATYILRFVVVTEILCELLRWTLLHLPHLVALECCLQLILHLLFPRLYRLCLSFKEGEELAFLL